MKGKDKLFHPNLLEDKNGLVQQTKLHLHQISPNVRNLRLFTENLCFDEYYILLVWSFYH